STKAAIGHGLAAGLVYDLGFVHAFPVSPRCCIVQVAELLMFRRADPDGFGRTGHGASVDDRQFFCRPKNYKRYHETFRPASFAAIETPPNPGDFQTRYVSVDWRSESRNRSRRVSRRCRAPPREGLSRAVRLSPASPNSSR